MSPLDTENGLASSADHWRARAAQLFAESDASPTSIGRELLRRRAVAAENIADATELTNRSVSAP
jgi:hypothetical protein